MAQLPTILAAHYRPATDHEVRSRSFGVLRAPRNPQADGWEQRRGTLDDQRIFGPLKDFECACGKYKGHKYQGMICDRCGVKLTTRAVRRERFGHIDLPIPIPHPLGDTGEKLSALPVLPASFWEAPAGTPLAQAYDDLARTASSGACKALAQGHIGLPDWTADQAREMLAAQLCRLVDLLLPVATFAHEWDLHEAVTLAWGLALEGRPTLANVTCRSCGYPLEGLDVMACPGCGSKLR